MALVKEGLIYLFGRNHATSALSVVHHNLLKTSLSDFKTAQKSCFKKKLRHEKPLATKIRILIIVSIWHKSLIGKKETTDISTKMLRIIMANTWIFEGTELSHENNSSGSIIKKKVSFNNYYFYNLLNCTSNLTLNPSFKNIKTS